MTAGYKLVRLASGAHSLHSFAHAETFHPVIGPVAEAEALYVKQLQLRERLQQHSGEFAVWDVGLGAAANALTVLRATRDLPCAIRLVSFDCTLEPLEFARQHTEALGYFGGYEQQIDEILRTQHVVFRDGPQTVDWQLHLGDFPTWLARLAAARSSLSPRGTSGERAGVRGSLDQLASSPQPSPPLGEEREKIPPPHAILFDAFSPAKNPAMWTLPLFTHLFQLLDPQRPCALPTYSRSTIMRVTLLLAGFYVGVGHATGKKEETTIAANSLELLTEPLDHKWLDRARRSHSAEPMAEPVYHIAPLTPESWEKLRQHPQFK